MIRNACGVLVLGFAMCSLSSAAQAEPWPGLNWGYGWGWPYSVYTLDTIPYFALHPPVYYSRPVARPYGYSPFAYPPGVMTPEGPPPQPQVLYNPHVRAGLVNPPGETQEEIRTARRPLRVVNPYVALPAQAAKVAGK